MEKVREEKKYRFFYHYYKQHKKMSVHFRNKCIVVQNIDCRVPAETKWQSTQPNLIMRGWCLNVRVENDIAVIE